MAVSVEESRLCIRLFQKKEDKLSGLRCRWIYPQGKRYSGGTFAKHPEWNLYLCGARGAEKAEEAGYKLTENVHVCGFVDTMSDQFNAIAEKCYYLLLPSCSESPSTSALTALRHGIIPIVMKGNGLDELWDYCRYFEDYHMESIEQTITEAVHVDEEVLQQQGRAAMEYADEHYTLQEYTRQIKNILGK